MHAQGHCRQWGKHLAVGVGCRGLGPDGLGLCPWVTWESHFLSEPRLSHLSNGDMSFYSWHGREGHIPDVHHALNKCSQ